LYGSLVSISRVSCSVDQCVLFVGLRVDGVSFFVTRGHLSKVSHLFIWSSSILISSLSCFPRHTALIRAGQRIVTDARSSSHRKTEPLKTAVSVPCAPSVPVHVCVRVRVRSCASERLSERILCSFHCSVPSTDENCARAFQCTGALTVKWLESILHQVFPRVVCKHFICISYFKGSFGHF
jgi:hypothetical protein